MQNFEFHNPTKIIFGTEGIEQLPNLLSSRKIMLLHGMGSIKKNGTYERIISALKDFKVFEFGGISPNPTYEKCIEAVEFIKKNDIEFILAVGGGSVIDSAKFIAAAFYFPKDPWMILNGESELIKRALPLGVVLTLPATGSEMNSFSVISRGPQKLSFASPLVYPSFSILDPTLTFSLDQRQIGNGIVDAYVHVLEQYMTAPDNTPLQDRMAEAILSTLLEEGPKSYKNPNDYSSRANHMWCATMALNSLIGIGTIQDWSTHRMGHELTALYGIDHARTLALVWSKNMKIRKDIKKTKMLQYAQRVLGISAGSEDEMFDLALKRTDAFFESMGVPTEFKAYPQIQNDVGMKVLMNLKRRGIVAVGEDDSLPLIKMMEIFTLR